MDRRIDNVDYSYILSKKSWVQIGEQMHNARQYIPAIFGRAPRNIAKHHVGFKAEEMWAWLEFFSIPLLYRRLPEKYLIHWNTLRRAFLKLVSSFDILKTELHQVHSDLSEFVMQFEHLYIEGRHSRIQCATSNMHGLLHLADYVEYLGPAWCS
jgi:hypothetical protein